MNEKVTEKPEIKKIPEDEIVTIRDFKSMIVGMDMIMGDDWTPNESQWRRIRQKINALIDTAERPGRQGSSVAFSNHSSESIVSNFPRVPAAENVPIGEAPIGRSAFAPPDRVPAPQPASNAPVADGRAKVKTPDIDTSNGYRSAYT